MVSSFSHVASSFSHVVSSFSHVVSCGVFIQSCGVMWCLHSVMWCHVSSFSHVVSSFSHVVSCGVFIQSCGVMWCLHSVTWCRHQDAPSRCRDGHINVRQCFPRLHSAKPAYRALAIQPTHRPEPSGSQLTSSSRCASLPPGAENSVKCDAAMETKGVSLRHRPGRNQGRNHCSADRAGLGE